MRLTLVVGLALALLLVPAAAQASDKSLKSTVKKELTTLEKAEKRFAKAMDKLESDGDAEQGKQATEKLITAVERFHSKVEAETAESKGLKTARTKLLKASETYESGLNKLIEALDADSKSKLKSALKTINRAYKQFYSAGESLGKAGADV
ncbi:hypothetical protein OJ997_34160 [Solirubrobacter phytolaccae]|uniref:Uncharacterized protein n=1 Tax=Solirubrobacter phytolaccae TaxID=1404360 RepID=A0A9X3NFY9_9ACTN|nr:hypothetical protein [Solirubrobacter phytolaccae]MDA0185401.1 hypothetical protein [Solirubrobacter phytolaccae]